MAADNELENLKTDCITALRKGDEVPRCVKVTKMLLMRQL